jgi:hypothetical protein
MTIEPHLLSYFRTKVGFANLAISRLWAMFSTLNLLPKNATKGSSETARTLRTPRAPKATTRVSKFGSGRTGLIHMPTKTTALTQISSALNARQ